MSYRRGNAEVWTSDMSLTPPKAYRQNIGKDQIRCAWRAGDERCPEKFWKKSPKQACCYLHGPKWQRLAKAEKERLRELARAEDLGQQYT